MTKVKIFTDSSFSSEIAKGVVLVDFFASWCGPCRILAPIIEEIAKRNENRIVVGKVDINSEEKTAEKYGVTSVPTLVLFKDGKEINRLVGLRDLDAIQAFLDASLAK